MLHTLRIYLTKKVILSIILTVVIIGGVYIIFLSSLTFNPTKEVRQMQQLAHTKEVVSIAPFESDECSGNVSAGWNSVVTELSAISAKFAATYEDMQSIPFAEACVTHDELYHSGEGGYVGRLRADNQLRQDILDYGIDNAELIQKRLQLDNTSEAIFVYELIAEAVYRGVRIGGAPCTGKAYAWGFGYNQGHCFTAE